MCWLTRAENSATLKLQSGETNESKRMSQPNAQAAMSQFAKRMQAREAEMRDRQHHQSGNENRVEIPVERAGPRCGPTVRDEAGHQ